MSNKPFNFYSFLKNVGMMVGIGAVMLLFFFYIYLPATTNHNETITVPDLEGMAFDDINELLTNRNLGFEVMSDSGYSEEYDPFYILSQNPKPGAKVKENRKIYLTLNAKVPPQVRMPNLINTDLPNAEDILVSNGLKRGEITYVPDRRVNAVISQKLKGEDVAMGTMIYKGSAIDLEIGNGEGIKSFPTPDFLGKTLAEVRFQIEASGLKLDEINFIKNDTVPANLVYKQLPPQGRSIRTGDLVEIWINRQEELPEEEEQPEQQ